MERGYISGFGRDQEESWKSVNIRHIHQVDRNMTQNKWLCRSRAAGHIINQSSANNCGGLRLIGWKFEGVREVLNKMRHQGNKRTSFHNNPPYSCSVILSGSLEYPYQTLWQFKQFMWRYFPRKVKTQRDFRRERSSQLTKVFILRCGARAWTVLSSKMSNNIILMT